MTISITYDEALKRNLSELQKILLIRTTLLGIEAHKHTTKVFIRVINDALHNDYMSHAIKVFEQSSKCASFWYLYKTNAAPINSHAKKVGYDINHLQKITDKLKVIRNGTHFHIDRAGVLDSKVIWSDASITGKELADAIDFVWGALCSIQESRGEDIPSLLDYTSDDVIDALKRIENKD